MIRKSFIIDIENSDNNNGYLDKVIVTELGETIELKLETFTAKTSVVLTRNQFDALCTLRYSVSFRGDSNDKPTTECEA